MPAWQSPQEYQDCRHTDRCLLQDQPEATDAHLPQTPALPGRRPDSLVPTQVQDQREVTVLLVGLAECCTSPLSEQHPEQVPGRNPTDEIVQNCAIPPNLRVAIVASPALAFIVHRRISATAFARSNERIPESTSRIAKFGRHDAKVRKFQSQQMRWRTRCRAATQPCLSRVNELLKAFFNSSASLEKITSRDPCRIVRTACSSLPNQHPAAT